MKSRFFHRSPALPLAVIGLLALAGISGCSKKTEGTYEPNLAPSVRLTHAPISSTSREKYSYRMNWIGYDPDGKVDYFEYKIDPADPDNPDSTWTRTTHNEEIIDFDAGTPDEPVNHNSTAPGIATAPHTFSIAAVDNQGMRSPTVYRAFFSTTVAPYIVVETPRPSNSAEALVTPSVRITFNGTDPDGPTGKPTRYVFRLFGIKNPDFPGIGDFISFATGAATKDSMRKLYAPTFGPSDHCPTCTPWQQLPVDSNQVQYTNLIPLQNYLFICTGFDAAGAYDPIFSRSKNMLRLNVSFAGTKGPVITLFNEFFNFTYATGGYLNDPSRYIKVEVPADQRVTFNWMAAPPEGAAMRRYRWVLDLTDLDDETPREDTNDWYHWSSWSLSTTLANVGPFDPGIHLFFLEAEDNNGLVSLGIVQFTVVRPTFQSDLLIVQDCRFLGDGVLNGVYQRPSGSWPNKAEIDTFFYARGGYPWRGAYATLPDSVKSPPGIFNGYAFDTLSTRQYITGIVPLAVLGRYRNVVWYVDKTSASRVAPPHQPTAGMVSLRFMAGEPSRGAPNTLATFMKQGGSAWVFGGGIATATLDAWNRTGSVKTEFTDRDNELVPGRFMYDYAHWRTRIEIGFKVGGARLNWQYPKFNSQSPARVNYPDAPNYANLVAKALYLTPRDRANPEDNPPPLRNPDSFWYATQYDSELLTNPAFIIEDLNGEAPGGDTSTMDTVYVSQEGQANYVDRPVMTYYHGLDFQKMDFDSFAVGRPSFEAARFMFSGFPLWFFSRPQQIALVDFVLHDVWGLQRNPNAPRLMSQMRASMAVRASSTSRSGAPQRLAPQRLTAQRLGSEPLLPQAAPLSSPGVQR